MVAAPGAWPRRLKPPLTTTLSGSGYRYVLAPTTPLPKTTRTEVPSGVPSSKNTRPICDPRASAGESPPGSIRASPMTTRIERAVRELVGAGLLCRGEGAASCQRGRRSTFSGIRPEAAEPDGSAVRSKEHRQFARCLGATPKARRAGGPPGRARRPELERTARDQPIERGLSPARASPRR